MPDSICVSILQKMSIRRRGRKLDISMPTNFEHRYHAGFDPVTGQYHGLPKVSLFNFFLRYFNYFYIYIYIF